MSLFLNDEMEQKADNMLVEAEKLCSKCGFLTFFTGDNYEDARDIFIKAGTCYKSCGNFEKAAGAYKRAADMASKSKNECDMVSDFEEAASCYAKAKDTNNAVQFFTKALHQYEKDQMYTKVAKTCVSLSEVTEGKEAMKWLEKAAEYYRLKGSQMAADDLMRKVADAKVKEGDYQTARGLYEQLARETLNNSVIRSGARKLFFMALLAQFATFTSDSLQEDVAGLRERFEEYQELDTQFDKLTREHMLVESVIEAIEEENLEKMEAAVMDYDKICVLDELKEKMLLCVQTVVRERLDSLR